MGLIIYLLIAIAETSTVIANLFSDKSEQAESIILGLSKERIFLVFCMLIALLFFFYLLFSVIRSYKSKGSILFRILEREKTLWVIIFICLFLTAGIFFIFIRERYWFGQYDLIIEKLKPVFTWLILLSIQTFFFTLIHYCFNFIDGFRIKTAFFSNKDVIALVTIFSIFFFYKCLFVISDGYGLMKDVGESKFFYAVKYLNDGIFLHSASADELTTNFPFLYPISIIFSFFVKNYSFELIKTINSLLTTSIIFPLFLLSNQLFSDKKYSYAVVIISSLIPYQYLLPVRLLSENLYFPLFLWTLFFIFTIPKNDKFRLHWDLLTGISIGLLYLTRYITLVLIPAFLISWWLKSFQRKNDIFKLEKTKVIHLILIALTIFVVYSPWIIISLNNGFGFEGALGFGIAKKTNPEQLTFANLIKWFLFYLSYIILMASPVLNLIIAFFHERINDDKSKRWLMVLFLISISFLAATVRHSWRADYNLEIPNRIMGRYIIYLLPMFLITGFLGIASWKESTRKITWQLILELVIAPLILVSFSYLLIVQGSIFPIYEVFIHPLVSIDVYYIKILGIFFFIYIPVFYLLSLFVMQRASQKLYGFAFISLILYFVWGQPAYLSFQEAYQTDQKIGAKISEFILNCQQNVSKDDAIVIYLPDSLSKDQIQDISWSLAIRNLAKDYTTHTYHFNNPNSIPESESVIMIYPTTNDAAYLGKYEIFSILEGDYVIQYTGSDLECNSKFLKKYGINNKN